MYTDLASLCLEQRKSFRELMLQMDRSRLGIVLVVDEERRLLGTVTDGDVRRAILANVGMELRSGELVARKAKGEYARPVCAQMGEDPKKYLQLLKRHKILHLPILDDQRRVVGLVTLDEFLPEQPLPLRAVVMAGGKGSRLHPLTAETPKPMLQVGDRPLLEIIIGRLRDAGIRNVKVTTHHHRQKITDHFGDGRDFGVELSYVEEDQPLGTAGGLGLMEPPTETTLVMNGDILTDVDFRAMLRYHREHEADLTVGVRQYELKVPYGVVECDGPAVTGLSEKPELGLFVNAGIYLLEPGVFRLIPDGRRFDMTDLIQRLLTEERSVVSFPIREDWLDIGQLADYERAHASRLKEAQAVQEACVKQEQETVRRHSATRKQRRVEPVS